MILSILPQAFTSALVITLLHSVWQIALITIILRILLNRKEFSHSYRRSQLFLSGLLLIGIASVATFIFHYGIATGWLDSPAEGASALTPVNTTIINAFPLNAPSQGVPALQPFDWIMTYQFQIMVTWLCGVALFAVRILLGAIGIARIKRQLNYNLPQEIEHLFISIQSKLQAPRRLRLGLSSSIKAPMVMGHIQPIIVLPLAVINQLSIEEVETIILHEMAHVLRKDYIQNIIVVTAETLFFYHPLLWWITSSLRQEREHSCDDFTVQHCPERITYAQTLVKIETLSQGLQNPMAMALYSNKYSLMKRIQRIMETKQTRNFSNYRSGILAAFLLISVALVGASWVGKDDTNAKAIVESKINKLENKIQALKKEIHLPNIGKVIHIASDTTELPEYSDQELQQAKSELRQIRDEIREKQEAQRDQMRELRDRQEDEIRDQKERMRELKRKLRDSDDGEYDEWQSEFRRLTRESDEWSEKWNEEAEEWAERWSEEAEEWAEKFEEQFDDEWVDRMEVLGEEISEQFDEEWAADMEAWGEEFADAFDDMDLDIHIDGDWMEGLAAFSLEMAELGAELGADIGTSVVEAFEDADWNVDDLEYDVNWGDANNPTALKKALSNQMKSDINLKKGKNSLVITDRTLKINGKRQTAQIYQNYKDLIISYQEDAFDPDNRTTIKFHFYGKDFDNSDRVSLSITIEK